jgi:hypothetical protein
VPLFKKRAPVRLTPERDLLIPLDDMPDAIEPALFLGAETFVDVSGFVFLDWETSVGVLTVAYHTTEQRGTDPEWVRAFKPGIRCLLAVARTGFHVPDGPTVHDLSITEGGRSRQWRHYARVIGQPAPYWPWDLGHRALIEAWRPGHATITAVPRQDPDMTPLLEFAALYPPSSPTYRVLTCYYFRSVQSAAGGSRMVLDALMKEQDMFPDLADKLALAARAVDAPEPGDVLDELGDNAIRLVFAEIMERKDTLAELVVDRMYAWGATKYFPFATVERYSRDDCAMLAEWITQLDEVPTYQPDPKFRVLPPRAGMQSRPPTC